MSATELLCHLFGIDSKDLSHQENLILEAAIFFNICEELLKLYRVKNKEYFLLINVSVEKENAMLEANFLRSVINDILITEDYSLTGIACYTQVPEDVIKDIVFGRNKMPSLQVSRKIIDLHRAARPDIYKEIIKRILKKIIEE